jgi:predicted nucleic acid-binding protein
VRGYTLDAGAFIALERRDKFMVSVLFRALTGGLALSIPQTVIAQIWRGGIGRQVNVARLIKASRAGVESVIIDDLTDDRAKGIGVAIGKTGHADIADVHVALLAAEQGHAVVTSDDSDIAAVDPHLAIVHV